MHWQIKHQLTKKDPQARIDQLQTILLSNRRIKTSAQKDLFLNPPSPTPQIITDLLPDLDQDQLSKSAQIIKKAISNQRPIIIYGDYDADGITATAILWKTIYKLGGNCLPFIPHRQKHGYGLGEKGLKTALKLFNSKNPLIITVDNGISSLKTAQKIKNSPADLIITDHHQPPTKLPPARAIVHSTHISGSAVSWLLASRLAAKPVPLDLVTLGTVCDVLPLTGPNRVLVKAGLQALRQTKNLGLKALCQVADIKPNQIKTYHLGFVLGPRINASGRLDHGLQALRLLTTTNPQRAQKIARQLDSLNSKRQQLTDRHTKQAINQFQDLPQLPPILITAGSDYHPGIIGLIASQLTERFHRPSLAIAIDENQAKGSARSISKLDITQIISSAEPHLSSFGGHAQAAGLSTSKDQLPDLKKSLLQTAQKIDPKLFKKTLKIEAHLQPDDLTFNTLNMIENFAPFGVGNPRPTFAGSLPVSSSRLVGSTKKHLKLKLKPPHHHLDAIGFYHADKQALLENTPQPHLAFTLQKNTFRGNTSLQLNLKDIKSPS